MEKTFKISVYKNNDIDAFAAYVDKSVKDNEAILLMNIDVFSKVIQEHKGDITFKELLIESLMHEFGHALEDWFDLEFSEDRIDKIVESYTEKNF